MRRVIISGCGIIDDQMPAGRIRIFALSFGLSRVQRSGKVVAWLRPLSGQAATLPRIASTVTSRENGGRPVTSAVTVTARLFVAGRYGVVSFDDIHTSHCVGVCNVNVVHTDLRRR